MTKRTSEPNMLGMLMSSTTGSHVSTSFQQFPLSQVQHDMIGEDCEPVCGAQIGQSLNHVLLNVLSFVTIFVLSCIQTKHVDISCS